MKDEEALPDPWILFTDGSSCIDGSRASLIIRNSEGMEFTYALRRIKQDCVNQLRLPEQIGPGKVKFLIVVIDYFTKWIEAKPVATITGAQIKKFVWDNIVCRFGLPGEIISESQKQFKDNPFKDWCEKLCTVRREKQKLDIRDFTCLMGTFTMIKSNNEETPFSLKYGMEAVIPVEIGMLTLRTAKVDMIKNDEALEINLDLLEEKREHAAIQEAKSKAMMEKYYNARVHNTSFKPGDHVYRSNKASHVEDGGRLGPKWEGPYDVTKALGKGAYKLWDRSGNILQRTWNIFNLKKFYVHEMKAPLR
nr:reverse transcriptase domain-containing protein [Tanacetum cinerariifolium]